MRIKCSRKEKYLNKFSKTFKQIIVSYYLFLFVKYVLLPKFYEKDILEDVYRFKEINKNMKTFIGERTIHFLPT